LADRKDSIDDSKELTASHSAGKFALTRSWHAATSGQNIGKHHHLDVPTVNMELQWLNVVLGPDMEPASGLG
jgi:hypothetical protein